MDKRTCFTEEEIYDAVSGGNEEMTAKIREHCASCKNCAAVFAEASALCSAMKKTVPVASPDLTARIMKAVKKEKNSPVRFFSSYMGKMVAAAAACVIIAATVAISGVFSATTGSPLTEYVLKTSPNVRSTDENPGVAVMYDPPCDTSNYQNAPGGLFQFSAEAPVPEAIASAAENLGEDAYFYACANKNFTVGQNFEFQGQNYRILRGSSGYLESFALNNFGLNFGLHTVKDKDATVMIVYIAD